MYACWVRGASWTDQELTAVDHIVAHVGRVVGETALAVEAGRREGLDLRLHLGRDLIGRLRSDGGGRGEGVGGVRVI